MKLFFLSMIFLAIAFNACAEEKIFLYGDYYNGMSREEFFRTGVSGCEEFPDDNLVCSHPDIPFADLEWTQFFQFNEDGLTCVAFGASASREAIDRALIWTVIEKYAPLKIAAGRNSLDYAPFYGKDSQKEFEREAGSFNRDLLSAPEMTAWLVKRALLEEYKSTGLLPADALVVKMGGARGTGDFYIAFELAGNSGLTFSR